LETLYAIVDLFPTLFRPFRATLDKTFQELGIAIFESQDRKSIGALIKLISLLECTAKVDKSCQTKIMLTHEVLLMTLSNLLNSLLVCIDEGILIEGASY
jgi:hypothetical protein